jgi:hypothetical protein
MKKTLVTTLIVLLAAAAAVSWYVFFYTSGSGTGATTEREVRRFFPLGIFGGGTSGEAPDGGSPSESGGVVFLPPVEQVAAEPVAAAMFTTVDGEDALRYIDRATGHIFDRYATSTRVRRVTNTTIPRIQKASWIDLLHPLVQYLDDETGSVETFVGTIHEAVGTTTEGFLTGDFLPPDVLAVATHGDGTIFYLSETESGSIGSTLSLDGSSDVVFESPLREWIPQWTDGRTVGMTTKPSSGVAGHFFLLNTDSGSFVKIFGGLLGLTIEAHPDGNRLLYASSADGVLLKVFDMDTRTAQGLPIRTLPEKCVWSVEPSYVVHCGVPDTLPAASIPDEWYRGTVLFSDSLQRIDTRDGSFVSIADSFDFGEAVDIISLSISGDGEMLSFVNKRDGSLWLVRLAPSVGGN